MLLTLVVLAGLARPPLDSGTASSGGAEPDRAAGAEDVAEWLARLLDPDAGRRDGAQSWLRRNLEPTDLGLLADSLRAGPAEVGARLARALGGDERHLELAVLLAVDREPAVAAVGRAAVLELAGRWSGSLHDPPLERRTFPAAWSERERASYSLRPDEGDLLDVLGRLDRLSDGPVPIVLDPKLDPAVARGRGPNRPMAPITGTWQELIEGVTRGYRAAHEVHGWREVGTERGAPPARAWVRVARRGDLGDETTAELLLEWCSTLAGSGGFAERSASARALAGLGWPAAISWMESSWVKRDDDAAYAGLLFAAARGRVAPGLTDASRLGGLLADYDELARSEVEASALRTRASRLARALGGLAPIDARGRLLGEVWHAGWPQLSARSRWLRLAIAEAQGSCPPPLAGAAAATLAADVAPALRYQALEALRAGGARVEVTLESPGRLWAWARATRRLDSLVDHLLDLRVDLPEGDWWTRPEPDGSAARAILRWASGLEGSAGAAKAGPAALGTWLLTAEPAQTAGAAIAGWPSPSRRRLSTWVASSPAADAALAARRSSLEAWAGLLDQQGVAQRLEELGPGPHDAESLLEFGALVADPSSGGAARAVVVDSLNGDLDEGSLLRAFEAAIVVLRRARLERLEEEFAARLRSTSARRGHPLAGLLWGQSGQDWPPAPPARPISLEARDLLMPQGL